MKRIVRTDSHTLPAENAGLGAVIHRGSLSVDDLEYVFRTDVDTDTVALAELLIYHMQLTGHS
jgi:hypothetical protein